MGKRRRKAAWGATFALLVASCATTPPEELAKPPRERPSATSEPAVDVSRPRALADTSFVLPSTSASACRAGDRAAVSLFKGGEETWSFAIPRPTGLTRLHGDTLIVAFGWDRGLQPGIGAIDLVSQRPLWQRFLSEEPDDLVVVDDAIVMAVGDEIRSISLDDGADNWVARTEFGLREIRLTPTGAYAIDPIAVHGIDTATGSFLWQQPIERPDQLEVDGDLLVVAADSRVLGIDVIERTLLWDEQVQRIRAGKISLGGDVALIDLSPDVAPAGGVVALDQQNGWERWELHNLDLIVWAGDDRFVASAAAADYRGGLAYDLLGVDAATGATVWTDPMSAPLRSSLLGSENTRLVVQDPHSAIGTVRLRQLDAIDGSVEWEINTTERYDGATISESGVARVYRLNRTFDGPRGELHTVRGTQDVHTLHTPDGITQSPLITEHGMVVISGESSVSCAGRQIASAEGT